MADSAQEKTEQPTPKKRKEAKEKGHKILIVDTSKGITKEVLSLIA